MLSCSDADVNHVLRILSIALFSYPTELGN